MAQADADVGEEASWVGDEMTSSAEELEDRIGAAVELAQAALREVPNNGPEI